jgi:hypothetical protein
MSAQRSAAIGTRRGDKDKNNKEEMHGRHPA